MNESLRTNPERVYLVGEVRTTPDLEEAETRYDEFLEELGLEAVKELLAVMYFGRDGGTFENALAIADRLPSLEAAADQISGKGPALEYIAFGFALLAGVPEDEEEGEDD